MRSIPLFFALIAPCLFGCASDRAEESRHQIDTQTRAKIEEIDSIVRSIVIEGKAAGIEWGIQTAHESAVIRAYGRSDTRGAKAVQTADQFRIASITKPLVASTVLKLVHLGKLSLEDSLAKFFPDYPNGSRITIYQLLSHTSGIPNWWDGKLPADTPENFPMCSEPHRYLQAMENSSLFAPGEFYSYSNTGYVLLGEIVEKVSGKNFERVLNSYVLTPAHMAATEMEYDKKPGSGWIKGYALDPDKPGVFHDPETYAMPFTAGGLRSNAADLLKFVDALHKGRIIPQELVARMTETARVNSGAPTFEAQLKAPKKPRPDYISNQGYGLGWNVMNVYGEPAHYHSGGIAGFNSYLLHLPKAQVTVVLLANTEDALVGSLPDILKIAASIK